VTKRASSAEPIQNLSLRGFVLDSLTTGNLLFRQADVAQNFCVLDEALVLPDIEEDGRTPPALR
jgi:hypothetical protein